MRKYIAYLVLISLLTLNLVQAGERGGNGGFSIVCRDKQGVIVKTELLDMFELRNQWRLEEQPFQSQEEGLAYVLSKLDEYPGYKETFLKYFHMISNEIILLEKGVELQSTEDALPIFSMKNCEYEQVATYVDSMLYINSEIYNKMDSTNKFALFVHETVFKIARITEGDITSKDSRKLTAFLLSKGSELKHVEYLLNRFVPETVMKPVNGMYESGSCKIRITTTGPKSILLEVLPSVKIKDCSIEDGVYSFTYSNIYFSGWISENGSWGLKDVYETGFIFLFKRFKLVSN